MCYANAILEQNETWQNPEHSGTEWNGMELVLQ